MFLKNSTTMVNLEIKMIDNSNNKCLKCDAIMTPISIMNTTSSFCCYTQYVCPNCISKKSDNKMNSNEIIDEKQKRQEQIKKIKELLKWLDDLDASLYQIQAQFLVATAIFNYIETLGMFLIGYEKGECVKRFNAFFASLGEEYKKLLEEHTENEVYNELRCGLTHELIPKKYNFTIFHVGTDSDWNKKSEEEKIKIRQEKIKQHNSDCGIKFLDKKWLIYTDKLLYDFNKAKNKLIDKIESGDEEMIKNFDEVAKEINLENFVI